MTGENEHADNTWLSSYLDEQLDSAERARVETHLADCPSCREEISSLRHFKRLMKAAPRRAMPPELISAIEDRVARPFRLSFPFALRQPRFLVPAGALTALALAAGLWFGLKRESPAQAIPLETLLAAHARYTAESLVPQGSLVSSTYSAQLTAQNDDPDQQAY